MSKKKQAEIRVKQSEEGYLVELKLPTKVKGQPLYIFSAHCSSRVETSNLVDRLKEELVDCRIVWDDDGGPASGDKA